MRTVISKPHKIIFHFSRATLKKKKEENKNANPTIIAFPFLNFLEDLFLKFFPYLKK